MFRECLRRVVRYKKSIGRYTIKVEYIDGRWYVWVFGPTLTTNKREDQLLFADDDKLYCFDMARREGLNFIKAHVSK